MSDSTQVSRRNFLQQTPSTAAVLATGALATTTTEAALLPPERDPDRKTIRVGVLNISVYSHLAAHWVRIINGPMSYTNLKITRCWDIDQKAAMGFARGHGCQSVKDPADMLGHVDAVIDGGYYNHPFNHVLMAPFLQAGLPCLVNRPFSNSVGKTRTLVELARKHKAPLLVPSAFGHNRVVYEARQFLKESRVTGYHATTGAEDFPTHGTHGLYFLSRAITDAGNPIVSVAYRGKTWEKPPAVLTLEHRDRDGGTFFGTLHSGEFGVGMLHIHTESHGSGRSFTLSLPNDPIYRDTDFWAPAIWAFQQIANGEPMPQTYDQILMKQQAYLAGFYSHLEKNGQPVRLDEVPDNWEAPAKLPARPGEHAYYDRLQKELGPKLDE
tara:strand:- start:592 stop:1740 length:1149 start_codon:yes stop_codon:yes gene_type:complete